MSGSDEDSDEENEIRAAFNPSVHMTEEYSTALPFFDRQHSIVKAEYFTKLDRHGADFEDKVVIGTLLHLAIPSNAGTVLGRYSAGKNKAASAEKNRAQRAAIPSTALILIFGDLFNQPNCFALMLERKNDFQTTFGASELARSYNVQVGKKYAVKEPSPSEDYLGDSIVMLKKPEMVVEVVPDGWPRQPMLPAKSDAFQVWFDETGLKIFVSKPTLLHGAGAKLTCRGYTCDMQGNCSGCYGKLGPKKALVMQCTIDVLNVPLWERSKSKTATFLNFRSFKFTAFFFKHIMDLASKHDHTIDGLYSIVRSNVRLMVEIVNVFCGWTIVGWMRKGVAVVLETGEEYISDRNVAHIISLTPSDMSVLKRKEFRDLLIDLPSDSQVPTAPLALAPDPTAPLAVDVDVTDAAINKAYEDMERADMERARTTKSPAVVVHDDEDKRDSKRPRHRRRVRPSLGGKKSNYLAEKHKDKDDSDDADDDGNDDSDDGDNSQDADFVPSDQDKEKGGNESDRMPSLSDGSGHSDPLQQIEDFIPDDHANDDDPLPMNEEAPMDVDQEAPMPPLDGQRPREALISRLFPFRRYYRLNGINSRYYLKEDDSLGLVMTEEVAFRIDLSFMQEHNLDFEDLPTLVPCPTSEEPEVSAII